VGDPNHDQPMDAVRPSLRTLANRRNALKSTGPRTVAGKRRAALNSRQDHYSEDLERQSRARGEDARDLPPLTYRGGREYEADGLSNLFAIA